MRTLEVKDKKIFVDGVEANVTTAHSIITNEPDGIIVLNMIIADIVEQLNKQFVLDDDEKVEFRNIVASKIL